MSGLVIEYCDQGDIDSHIEICDDIDVRYELTKEEPLGIAVAGPPGPQGPAGLPGSSVAADSLVVDEEPIGVIDGSNATFTSQFSFVPESIEVFINGLAQRRITDFNTTGLNTIHLSDSPSPGDSIRIHYLRS